MTTGMLAAWGSPFSLATRASRGLVPDNLVKEPARFQISEICNLMVTTEYSANGSFIFHFVH